MFVTVRSVAVQRILVLPQVRLNPGWRLITFNQSVYIHDINIYAIVLSHELLHGLDYFVSVTKIDVA